MKVGGGLCSEGTLSSVLRLQACSRVSEYHSPEKKFDAQGCYDRMRCWRSAY